MNRIAIEHGREPEPYRFRELRWDPDWTVDDVQENVKIEGANYIRPVIVLTETELNRFISIGSGFRCNGDIRDFFFQKKEEE